MKTVSTTLRFSLITFIATVISFGAIVTPTYAKSHKVGGAKSFNHQNGSQKKFNKGAKAEIGNSTQQKAGGNGRKSKQLQRKKSKKYRVALGAISAGTDPVSSSSQGQKQSRSEQFINRFDQNSDSQVTLAEIQSASQTKFSSLDADANGSISSIELSAANIVTVADRVTKIISKEDNDGDGSITTSEAYQLVNRVIAGGSDTDSNGVISNAELSLHLVTMQTNGQLWALDTDKNGSISSAEYDITSSSQFKKLDIDGNGIVGD